MQAACQTFLDSLVTQSAGLRAAYIETLGEWAPDEPPITVLFGALGSKIAEDFDSFGADVRCRIFEMIEAGMVSGDQLLATAVATGLIESIVAKAAKRKDRWREVLTSFGERSRKHAEAWLG